MSGGLWSQNARYGTWPWRTMRPARAKKAESIVEFESNCAYSGAGHRRNVSPATHAVAPRSVAHSKAVTGEDRRLACVGVGSAAPTAGVRMSVGIHEAPGA